MRRLVPLLPLLLLGPACSGEGEGDDHGATTGTTPGTTGASATSVSTSDASAASMSTTAASASGSSGGSDPSGDPTTGDPTTGDLTTGDPSGDPPGDPCPGYATRYWDCCKAHCGWPGNVNPATDPLLSCDQLDAPIVDPLTSSACDAPAPSSAFTCSSNAPWAVSDTLAYGFAAVPASGDICGRCYRLDFDGSGHYSAQDPGSVALAGKAMIVQATNIGYDVGGGQFDILTPGGGVGLFDACSFQWGVDKAELGATYGGFMTACQEMFGGDHAKQKECVLGRCDAVFADPALAELRAGCHWYVDWYEAADNPNLHYQEVACPPELVAISGIDRGPLNDVGACMGGGGGPPCTQEEMDACNCDWTNGGTTCGDDDGSCCWTACCG